MILSHTDVTFAYRRQLLIAGIAVCAIVAPLFPAKSTLVRVIAPFEVVVLAAIAYGFIFISLSAFERFFPRLALLYGLFFYYAGLYGPAILALMWCFWTAAEPPSDFTLQDINPAIQAASCWATAAATYNVVFTERP